MVTSNYYYVISAGGDGSICLNDMRRYSNINRTRDNLKEEPTCITLIRNDQCVVSGTMVGDLNLFRLVNLHNAKQSFKSNK